MRIPTLREVATLAGVSTGTVSNYLNKGRVREKNRIRIENAIKILDYTPSHVAKSFARGKSSDIMLYILSENPIVSSTWVHEQAIIQGLNDRLIDSDLFLKIRIASKDELENNIREIEECIKGRTATGMVLLSPWVLSDRILSVLDYHRFPAIVIGAGSNKRRKCLVDYNNTAPIYEIVMKLSEQGHTRFGLIGGFVDQTHMIMREKGYRKALSDLGLQIAEELILYGDYSLESGFHLANELLDTAKPPTAIICGNDYVAAGAIKAIRSRGLRVPEHISVSGFDDTVVSNAATPSITSVQAPAYEIGSVAIDELLKIIENPEYESPNIILDCCVVYKESTGSFCAQNV